MAKTYVRYICNNCGEQTTSWSGRCPYCEQWNTLEEFIEPSGIVSAKSGNAKKLKVSPVSEAVKSDFKRLVTSLNDVDTVLGGGLVAGSMNLLAGQPGIGKSTLLMQIAYGLSKTKDVLYVSGEESSHQVGLRANRLGALRKNLFLANSNSAEDIAAAIASSNYSLVIVDSIQSITCEGLHSNAGSISQITSSAQLISLAAKQTNTAVIIVGHVTKEGSIAGPKILEHAVDVVLQLEGDRFGGFKVLRAIKNRYGSTNEAGIFEMHEDGLIPVDNPSKALLAERQAGGDGSIVLATMEGTRPLLVEVQALVNTSTYGYPKRAASGFDLNRLNLLIAVLEKRTKLKLADKDIFINVVGGIHLNDPGSDLAICMAIGSASKELALKDNLVVFGEVGLSGEVRHVPFVDKRLNEAKKLGFKGGIGPASKDAKSSTKLHSVRDLKTALNTFLK
jgi:DNA repair protein RadA/Sms